MKKLTMKQKTDIQMLKHAIELVKQGGALTLCHVDKMPNRKVRRSKAKP